MDTAEPAEIAEIALQSGGKAMSCEPQFEVELRRLRLVPSYEATQSAALRRWVDAHWRTHYVPEELLVIWGYNQSLMPEPGYADLKQIRTAAPKNSAAWRR